MIMKTERKRKSGVLVMAVGALAAVGAVSIVRGAKKMVKGASDRVRGFLRSPSGEEES